MRMKVVWGSKQATNQVVVVVVVVVGWVVNCIDCFRLFGVAFWINKVTRSGKLHSGLAQKRCFATMHPECKKRQQHMLSGTALVFSQKGK